MIRLGGLDNRIDPGTRFGTMFGIKEAAGAKIFIEFVVLVIRNKIYTSLKDVVLEDDSRANYMNVPAAIKELEKIEMIRQTSGEYRLDHAVTATQKAILKAFKMWTDDAEE